MGCDVLQQRAYHIDRIAGKMLDTKYGRVFNIFRRPIKLKEGPLFTTESFDWYGKEVFEFRYGFECPSTDDCDLEDKMGCIIMYTHTRGLKKKSNKIVLLGDCRVRIEREYEDMYGASRLIEKIVSHEQEAGAQIPSDTPEISFTTTPERIIRYVKQSTMIFAGNYAQQCWASRAEKERKKRTY